MTTQRTLTSASDERSSAARCGWLRTLLASLPLEDALQLVRLPRREHEWRVPVGLA
jgi:hypothetical protein